MIIRYNKDLSKQDIFANGDELAQIMGHDRDNDGNRVYNYPDDKKEHVVTIDNPVLVTNNYRISNLEPSLRDTVFALFSRPVTTTEYDGTKLRFEQKKYTGAWGPSIDTLLFCRGLEHINLEDVTDAIELGCGSGFLSKYTLDNAPNLENMTLVDFNKYAILCAYDNINDPRAMFVTGDAVKYLTGKSYDLILCNPPYILRPKSIDDNAYEGLELLHYMITNADEHLNDGGKIITNISSISRDEVDKFIEDAGVEAREIDAMEVPLKVYNVLNNEEWMNYLLDGHHLKKERKDGYDYWQRIAITEITV
ncbi:MAG: methyltransferase [Candidatus Aenigmarchaeota archaeon]|nr:methyltransferase [Candidatus Aenigmarchaeota archaeon]